MASAYHMLRVEKSLQLFNGTAWKKFDKGAVLGLHLNGKLTEINDRNEEIYDPNMTSSGSATGRLEGWVETGVVTVFRLEQVASLPAPLVK